MDRNLIKERRKAIEDNSPCDGCGASLAACKAQRGKDPTAPSWFGCCARGTGMLACRHVPDSRALQKLLTEIEDGDVRPVEDDLLASIKEHPRPIRMPREGLFDGIYPEHYYARDEDR